MRRKGRVLGFVYGSLSVYVVATLTRSLVEKEYFRALTCLLTLALFTLPSIVEKKFRLHLSELFEGLVLIFIFSAEILGEIHQYYLKIPHWDTVLHGINGFMFAAFGFALLDMISRDGTVKFRLSPRYLSLVAFCFSMTVGVLWEIFEFGMDAYFHTDMQKDAYLTEIYTVFLNTETVLPLENIQKVVMETADGKVIVLPAYLDVGLIDTMKDLMVNFVGAFLFGVIGYAFLKKRGEGRIARLFIPQLETANTSENQGNRRR